MTELIDWNEIPSDGHEAYECGTFVLDHAKSEFICGELGFKNQASAKIVICTKPVFDQGFKSPVIRMEDV